MSILIDALNYLSAFGALLAAFYWLKSALIKTPTFFSIHVARSNQRSLGGNPLDGTYIGHGYSKDLTDLANALKKQSKISARAAICAGVAAFLRPFPFY